MTFKHDEFFASDALPLGRLTYEGFAAAWPSMIDEQGFADRMNTPQLRGVNNPRPGYLEQLMPDQSERPGKDR